MKLALLTGLIFLSACEMQQDPIAGAPEAIREGRPPDTSKPVPEKPLDRNALQIDAPSLVNGRVASPVEIRIQGRVMMAGVDFQLSVDNLDEFPGATFDTTTGEFKWTPAKALMGGFPSVELPLRITMATIPNKENATITVEKKTISLVIVNTYSKPIINSVGGSNPLPTGSRHVFAFDLEDVDAVSLKDVAVEVRECASTYYATSVAHLVEIRRVEQSSSGPGRYSGEAVLDLSSAGGLNSGTYCFGLMAISRHGVVSDIYKKEFSIEAKMKATKITQQKALEMTVGEKVYLAFSFYDPSGVGQLSVKSMDDIATMLPGSSLSCTSTWSTRSQLDCAGFVDATSAQIRYYTLNFAIENAGARPTQSTVTNHMIRIQVRGATP